eukprot:1823735-Pyramimonas_sp.AAC.1
MRHWLNKGWAEHQIRRWHSLRNVERDGDGRPFAPQGQDPSKHKKILAGATSRELSTRSGALQRRCLHMPRICRPQARLPHETPIKKPEL